LLNFGTVANNKINYGDGEGVSRFWAESQIFFQIFFYYAKIYKYCWSTFPLISLIRIPPFAAPGITPKMIPFSKVA